MADIGTAQQQIQQARSQIAQRRAEAERAKEQLRRSQEQLRSQQALRQAKGSGIKGRQERKKVISEIEKQKGNVRVAEEKIKRFEEEQLKPVEEEIKRAQEIQSQQAKAQEDLKVAKKVFYGGLSTSILGNKQQREFYAQLVSGKEVAQ